MRVLVVEDDAALLLFLRKWLEREGHNVVCATDGEQAVALAMQELLDLIVLDLNLPKLDGIDVLRALRSAGACTSILVLTGRASVDDRVSCLDLGADDYLLKPFSVQEMMARCRAIGRRRGGGASNTVRHGDLEVDRVTRTVVRAGTTVDLTPTEYGLLDYLLQHRGRAVTRTELLENVWRSSPDAGTNVVDVYVNYLRRKLQTGDAAGDIVTTVRGAGYTIRSFAKTAEEGIVHSMGMVRGFESTQAFLGAA